MSRKKTSFIQCFYSADKNETHIQGTEYELSNFGDLNQELKALIFTSKSLTAHWFMIIFKIF